jgi:hypothetical protein
MVSVWPGQEVHFSAVNQTAWPMGHWKANQDIGVTTSYAIARRIQNLRMAK